LKTPLRWLATSLLVVGPVLAGEWPASPAGLMLLEPARLDPVARNAWIDRRLTESGPAPQADSLDVPSFDRLLQAGKPAALARASAATDGAIVNPEPSSLLIWGACSAGLAAAGYGVRRRQNAETL
jgi:hypothetical protein